MNVRLLAVRALRARQTRYFQAAIKAWDSGNHALYFALTLSAYKCAVKANAHSVKAWKGE